MKVVRQRVTSFRILIVYPYGLQTASDRDCRHVFADLVAV
jgi:hypothetical protein